MQSRPKTSRDSSREALKPVELTDEYLREVIRKIPGYDPYAGAEAEGYFFDCAAARRAIEFFHECLKHVEGKCAGKPFWLEEWQQAIIANLFGWMRTHKSGVKVRRYREAMIYVPRKNGKTPLCAGMCDYVLFCDNEPGAQIYSAAADREQAALVYRHAKGMVLAEPELDRRAQIFKGAGHRSIVLKDDPSSVYKVLSADADTKHGGNSHLAIIDELHAQPNRDLVDVLQTSMASENRLQPILVYITTADYMRPSICNEKYDYACRVRDNGGDPAKPGYDLSFLPVIYELTIDEDWRDEKNWAKANPNLGVSVSLEYLRRQAKIAQESPAYENTFRRLHMNQRTKQEHRVIDMPTWNAGAGAASLVELEKRLHGRIAIAGFDMASTEDLASFGLVFPLNEDDRELFGAVPEDFDMTDAIAIISRSFCPETKVEKRARMKVPYDVWQQQGHLIATMGDMIDYDAIFDEFARCSEIFNIVTAGVDPASGGKPFAQRLNSKYGEEFAYVVAQTFDNLSGPFKELLRRITKKRIIHGANPVLDWQAGNLAAHFRGKLPPEAELKDHLDKVPIIPSKQSSADKIDGMTAITIAMARMLASPDLITPDDGPTVMVV